MSLSAPRPAPPKDASRTRRWVSTLRSLLRIRSLHQKKVVSRLNHTQRRKIFRYMREHGRSTRHVNSEVAYKGSSLALSERCVLVSLDPLQECLDTAAPAASPQAPGASNAPSMERAETPLAVLSVDDFSMFHVLQSMEKK